MRARRRWTWAIVLCAVALVAVTGTALAAYNPWRLVRLERFGRPTAVTAALFVAPLLLGVAVWLVVRDWVARGIVAGAALLLAGALCVGGIPLSVVFSRSGEGPPVSTTVLAVAPGGRFELVDVRYSDFGFVRDVLRIRSRAGLRSRESAQVLACFRRSYEEQAAPDRVLRSARFVDDTRVELAARDGVAWTTTFDPRTLVAAATLPRGCTG
ncbi:hypothetical protein [Dactylosporangium darangshiense]|uniref:hypothetical protein n=1 Tax=Dactylosporangium darangshiense TaxID=579108 RepID=UPI0031EA3D72